MREAARRINHSLSERTLQRLKDYAAEKSISADEVLEHSLQTFFASGNDDNLGEILRKAYASERDPA